MIGPIKKTRKHVGLLAIANAVINLTLTLTFQPQKHITLRISQIKKIKRHSL